MQSDPNLLVGALAIVSLLLGVVLLILVLVWWRLRVTRRLFAVETERRQIELNDYNRERDNHQQQLAAAIDEATTQIYDENQRIFDYVAHELQTPVGAVIMALQRTRERIDKLEDLQLIKEILGQMTRIHRDIQAFQRLAHFDGCSVFKETVDLRNLLFEEKEAALTAYKDIEIDLTVHDTAWPLPLIDGDRGLLTIAIHNLFDNAWKYGSRDKPIRVDARSAGGMLEIEVANAGRGIPQESMEYIFKRGGRGPGTEDIPGRGLGLALTKQIIELHDGQFLIESRVHGTVARILLPISEEPISEEPISKEPISKELISEEPISEEPVPVGTLA